MTSRDKSWSVPVILSYLEKSILSAKFLTFYLWFALPCGTSVVVLPDRPQSLAFTLKSVALCNLRVNEAHLLFELGAMAAKAGLSLLPRDAVRVNEMRRSLVVHAHSTRVLGKECEGDHLDHPYRN